MGELRFVRMGFGDEAVDYQVAWDEQRRLHEAADSSAAQLACSASQIVSSQKHDQHAELLRIPQVAEYWSCTQRNGILHAWNRLIGLKA